MTSEHIVGANTFSLSFNVVLFCVDKYKWLFYFFYDFSFYVYYANFAWINYSVGVGFSSSFLISPSSSGFCYFIIRFTRIFLFFKSFNTDSNSNSSNIVSKLLVFNTLEFDKDD